MSSQDSGFDWWLLLLVAVIFLVGIGIYIGWDDVGSNFRHVMRTVRSVF